MKIKHVFMALLFTALFQSAFGQPYFILGRLYDALGNSANAAAENSFASVALFREGISGQIGKQNNGPYEDFPEKIYPAGYNNANTPAYCFTDVGSTDWLDTVNPPQRVRAVFQVMNGLNGWNGGTFVGTSLTDIKPADMPGSTTELIDTRLVEVKAPKIISVNDNGIDIEFTGLDYADITGYGLYRENSSDSITDKLAVLPQSAGSGISYSDTSAVPGKTYRYSISVIFKWGGGSAPAGYETFVKSASSAQCVIPVPSPTITETITATHTATVTETFTITPTISLTPVITMTATITVTAEAVPELKIVKENIMKERVIIFTNPVSGRVMKIGFAAESDCDASVYLYNVTGESAQKFDFKAEKGANIQELVLKNLSPGLYLLRITLNYGDKKDTLPKRKFAVIK